jgi:hypothetical protein
MVMAGSLGWSGAGFAPFGLLRAAMRLKNGLVSFKQEVSVGLP